MSDGATAAWSTCSSAQNRSACGSRRSTPSGLRGLAGEAPHQGVVALAAELEQAVTLDDVLNRVDANTLLLLLDGVTDPRNLGACLRVADAAGVSAVIVPRDRSAGLTPSALKAAAGAAETVPLIAVTNLARAMDDLRDADVRMVGAAGEAEQSLFDARFDRAARVGSRCGRRGAAAPDA